MHNAVEKQCQKWSWAAGPGWSGLGALKRDTVSCGLSCQDSSCKKNIFDFHGFQFVFKSPKQRGEQLILHELV